MFTGHRFLPLNNRNRLNIIHYMVPIRLRLKNFLCYRGEIPPLDFGGIHVACLSGQNGHGKSALLDSITWVLWGKARARDDALIYYGADEMRVELEFKARDDRYRVARRRTKPTGRGRSGSSDLQLQIANRDEYTPITRNSLRETEAEIQRIIGMDYDTFINSAFILQGRADEFTNKTAGQRKEVLGKLIGLGEYEELQAKAKTRAREEEGKASQVEGRLQQIQQQIARKPVLLEDRQRVIAELVLMEGQLNAKQAECNEVKARVDVLREETSALDTLRQEAKRQEQKLEQQRAQLETHQGRIQRYQSVIASREDIDLRMAQLGSLRTQHDAMSQARTVYDQLHSRESELSLIIAQERSRLEEKAKGLQRQVEHELEPVVEAVSQLERRLQDAKADWEKVSSHLQSLDIESANLVTLTGHVGRLESEMRTVKAEGEQLREKQLMFNSAEGSATCPLCGTPLGEDKCNQLSQLYQSEIDEKIRLFRGVQAEMQDITEKKTATEKVLAERPVIEEQRDQVQQALAFQSAELVKAANAAEQLNALRGEVSGLQMQLERHDYATQEQIDLAEVQNQLVALGYSAEAHHLLYQKVQKAQSVEEQVHRLQQAEEALPQETQALDLARQMVAETSETLEELYRKIETIAVAVRELPILEDDLGRHRAIAEGLQRTYRSLLQQQGDVEGDLRRLEDMAASIQVEQQLLLAAQDAQGLYQELEVAFGRQGVQAMLIDTLLPKVEDTANELLARMTDGRMHVKLETQRERRGGQGGAIETLDITISDELGARAYELFSGGEAFRINLALRIALSKELARRRGASLPTLFIDEGFGTQDASGRDRILDVMGAIQDDFEQIFVITHLEDLKDAFPVHIQVEKDERGASVWIT